MWHQWNTPPSRHLLPCHQRAISQDPLPAPAAQPPEPFPCSVAFGLDRLASRDTKPCIALQTTIALMSTRASSNVNFSLMAKGKAAFLKVSYERISEMLLVKRAWQQLQIDCGMHADSSTSASSASDAIAAQVALTSEPRTPDQEDSVPAVLKSMKPPEWHKNGATLRLPEGHPNAVHLLTTILHMFESRVQRQLNAAEEDVAAVSAVLAPTPEEHTSQSVAQKLNAAQSAESQPTANQEQVRPPPKPMNRSRSPRAKALPLALPPGVSMKQEGAAVYFAQLPCDRGTMLQIAGPKWRRMVDHLKPRALVERWCKWDQAFHVKGLRDDVVHTVNMLYEEIQRFKSGTGSRFSSGGGSGEDFAIPHG
jgi:hypothetical protein